MKSALLLIDYVESCCLEKYERPLWGCTCSKVRGMASRLARLVERVREQPPAEVIWINPCPWTKEIVHPNIAALYAENPDAEFYTDGTGASTFYAVTPANGEHVFEKNSYSAFSGTDGALDAYLRRRSITQLFIAGVYSTGCVDATVCEAFHRGYGLTIVGDCVETFDSQDKQDYQRHLLREWQYLYGKVATSEQV